LLPELPGVVLGGPEWLTVGEGAGALGVDGAAVGWLTVPAEDVGAGFAAA
jgi:hypothetical protein